MSILAECPICRRKQSVKNKLCCQCEEDLDRSKRSKRVRYWISYRLPKGKQRRELVGYSISKARDADGKRRAQKRENRIFEILPESKMTFNDLTEWYLSQESVKVLASYTIIKVKLDIFNKTFGAMIVQDITPADLKNYQVYRQKKGLAPGTIDQDIGKVKTMINVAFFNNKIGGRTLKTFKRIKKTLKKGSDYRTRILSNQEFEKLMENVTGHTKSIIATAYYTGMRKGEILKLTWDKVDLKDRVIRLGAGETKDREARNIPICKELLKILLALPNRIHKSGRDNHVFQYRGEPISDIRAGLKKACKAADIKYGRSEVDGFIFHDLRHTFNTNMRKAGVPESVIMAITGHSTREMFDRYNTVDAEDALTAVDLFEKHLANVVKNVDQIKK